MKLVGTSNMKCYGGRGLHESQWGKPALRFVCFFAKVIPLEAHVNKRLCGVGKSSCA